MRIIAETETDHIEYEADGVIACVINPKTGNEEQVDSASMVIGVSSKKEIVERAAASLSSIIDSMFPNVLENAIARAVARVILGEQSSTYMKSEVQRNDMRPVEDDKGKE